MVKKHRLSDLYITGTEVTVGDPPDDITVWVQKLSPVQNESAFRSANAVRASVLALKRLPEGHEDLQSYEADLEDQTVGMSFVDILSSKRQGPITLAKEDEVAAEEEWSEDGYIQSLKDSWDSEMMGRYAMDQEDEEATRVHSELERFAAAVAVKVEGEMRHVRSELEETPKEDLRKKVLAQILDFNSDVKWMNEYRRHELFYSVRVSEEEHRKLYFEDLDEVTDLAGPVVTILTDAYQELSISPLEVKS